jgi:hypothetical protein
MARAPALSAGTSSPAARGVPASPQAVHGGCQARPHEFAERAAEVVEHGRLHADHCEAFGVLALERGGGEHVVESRLVGRELGGAPGGDLAVAQHAQRAGRRTQIGAVEDEHARRGADQLQQAHALGAAVDQVDPIRKAPRGVERLDGAHPETLVGPQ